MLQKKKQQQQKKTQPGGQNSREERRRAQEGDELWDGAGSSHCRLCHGIGDGLALMPPPASTSSWMENQAGRDVATASERVPEWDLPFAEAWMIVVFTTTQPFPFLCSPYGSRTLMLCTRPWGSTELLPAFPTPHSHLVQT